MRRWTEAAKRNAKAANLICAATCARCAELTCLGCGEEPARREGKVREVDGYYLDWCCRDGRLFGIWILLARFDQVELHAQASSAASVAALGSGSGSGCGGGGGGRKGIGYGGRETEYYDPYGQFRFGGGMGGMGPPMAGGLTAPLDFQASETKTDGLLGTILELISEMVPGRANRNLPPELHGMLQLGLLVDKVAELMRNDSLDDVTARADVYGSALRFVAKLGSHPELIALVQTSRYYKQRTPGLEALSSPTEKTKSRNKKGGDLVLGEKIASVGERLKQLAKQSEIVNSAADSGAMTSRSGKTMLRLCQNITAIHKKIATNDPEDGGDSAKPKDKWEVYHQEYAISQDEGVFNEYHMYYSKAYYMDQSHPGRMKRLVTEVANMATSLPVGIFVRVSESRPDVMRCLIMGPPDSPYAYGLFE